MGDSYGYSVQDMRASRMAGKNLDARKGEAARYAIDRLTNSIAWKGDAENNLVGVLSEDNDIPIYTLGTGAQGSKTDWSSKTIDEIILDVSGMLAQVNLATQNTEHPDTLAIPSDTYTRLSLQRIPETRHFGAQIPAGQPPWYSGCFLCRAQLHCCGYKPLCKSK